MPFVTNPQELLLELDENLLVRGQSGFLEHCDFLPEHIESGSTLTEALKRLWNADVQQICKEAGESGKTLEYQILVNSNSVQQWYTLKAEPIIADHAIQGTLLRIHNSSLEKRNEMQKKLHEKMSNISLMAGQIAHKLNNPLAAVLNRVGSLLVTDLEDASVPVIRSELELIQEQIYSMSIITNALVAFSKESATRFSSLQINDIIEKSIELSRLLQMHSNVNYNIKLSSNLPPILGNEITLEQSFINVIRNALESMPNGGEFRVTSEMDSLSDEYIRITFQDTGCGISKNNIELVFDPFFKTKDENHSGLGLSISYGIIANHNGIIELNSTPDHGTTVTVLLPRYNAGGFINKGMEHERIY